MGAILGVHPWYAVALLAVFVLVFAVSRWVALGSLLAAALMLVGGLLAAFGRLPGAIGLPTMIWAWAVSYTHLDVYKRQIMGVDLTLHTLLQAIELTPR